MRRLLHLLVCAASAASIAMLAVIVAMRVGYPHEIEWLEGWMVDSVRQILDGRPLYAAPSVDFVPSVYNPVYFYVTAALAWPMGAGFAPARLVSALSTFGILALLIFRLNPSARSAGLVAAGLYAASYRFSGAWMDIARADSLFLLLVLSALLVGRDARAPWRDVAAGVSYSLAFFTKQPALAVVAIVFLGQLVFHGRRYWRQWLTFAVVSASSFAMLDWATDGWYSFYAHDNPMHFEPSGDPWHLTSARRLLPLLLVTAVMMVALLARQRRHERVDWRTLSTLIFAMALVGSTWAAFRQRGTYDNVFLPACLGFAMCAGLTYEEFRQKVAAHRLAFSAVAFLVALQFVVFRYNPVAQIPTRADRVAGDRFISLLRNLPGRVVVWSHGNYGAMAGKGSYAHDLAISDAAGIQSRPPRSEDHRWRRQQVTNMWPAAVKQQAFDWIVIDSATSAWRPYYLEAASIADFPREFTGHLTHPQTLLIKNPIVHGGRLDLTDQRLNFLFGTGWGLPNHWGRSLIGENATVAIALEPGYQYQVELELQSSCRSVVRGATVGVWWNGRLVRRQTLAGCGLQEVNATLTPDSIDPNRNILRLDAGPANAGSAPTSRHDAGTIGMTALAVVRIESPAGKH